MCNMDLNFVDLGDVRHLLVELARALSPLANPTSSAANSLFLTRRFTPPEDLPTALYQRHPVQVLVKLHEVQEEVQKWVGASEPEEQAQILAKESKEKIPEKELKPQTKAASFEHPQLRAGLRKDASISPLVREAKQLIHQVQGAIARLSSSSLIQQSDETILRDALKKLKPGLDRIIQAIAEVQQKSPEEKGKLREEKNMPSIPVPMRQKLVIQKLRELREEKTQPEEIEKDKPVKRAVFSLDLQQNEVFEEKKGAVFNEREQIELPSKNAKGHRLKRSAQETVRIDKKTNVETQIEQIVTKKTSEERQPTQRNTHSEIKPVALPISPLIFEPKKPSLLRKKKKRKGFWFKEEEETK